MPNLPGLTDKVIVATVVLLILYNVIAGLLGGADATISGRIQHHAARFPIIPAVLGGLLAHWFWPVRGIRD